MPINTPLRIWILDHLGNVGAACYQVELIERIDMLVEETSRAANIG